MNLITKQTNSFIAKGNMADIYTKSLKDSTRLAYIRDIKDFFAVENINDITIEMIQSVNTSSANQFRESLIDKDMAVSTVNRKLTSLSNFYNFLCRREIGIMDYNPFSSREGTVRLKNRKTYSNTRCLTRSEISQMIEATKQDKSIIGLRNRLVLLLLATTGMRREEVVSIKLKDICTNQGRLIIEITGKGDKERIIMLSPTTQSLMFEYFELRNISLTDKDEYLIASHNRGTHINKNIKITTKSLYNIIKSVAVKAGLDASNISPHCFRHTYATESLEMGIDLKDVADLMGHADLSTTRRYEHTNRILKHNPATALDEMFTMI